MRKRTRGRENKREGIVFRCRDCAHSYDWHHPAVDGHLTLCRCPYMMNGGEFSILLNDPQCEHFKPLKNADTEEQV